MKKYGMDSASTLLGANMNKYFFFLSLLLSFSVYAQEESEISNADIIESIEDINQRLDRLMPNNEVLKSSMEIGFVPFSARILPDIDDLNEYMSKSGTYEDYSGKMLPFINGIEFFTDLKLSDSLTTGLNYYRYTSNTYGFHASNSYVSQNDELGDYAEAVDSGYIENENAIDNNDDGIIDYYSYGNIFITGIELYAEYNMKLPLNLCLKIGPKIGYGYEEIEFTSYERSLFEDVSPDQKLSFRRSSLILGGDIGLSYMFKRFELVFVAGLSYNLPLTDWMPVAGVTQDDIAPENYSNMNIKLSLGPVISIKI